MTKSFWCSVGEAICFTERGENAREQPKGLSMWQGQDGASDVPSVAIHSPTLTAAFAGATSFQCWAKYTTHSQILETNHRPPPRAPPCGHLLAPLCAYTPSISTNNLFQPYLQHNSIKSNKQSIFRPPSSHRLVHSMIHTWGALLGARKQTTYFIQAWNLPKNPTTAALSTFKAWDWRPKQALTVPTRPTCGPPHSLTPAAVLELHPPTCVCAPGTSVILHVPCSGGCCSQSHPHSTLGMALGVTVSPLPFRKAQLFALIVFWLEAAEEGNDYGFYYLLQFSTSAVEQLWLKWWSTYSAFFLSQVFLFHYNKDSLVSH